MADGEAGQKPAWLTDDIADEWVSQEDDQQTPSDHSHPISDLSLAHSTGSPLNNTGTHSRTSQESIQPVGTFRVREDVPASANTPIKSNFLAKGIFSPLALERMFEPPSPPEAQPHTSSTSPRPAILRPTVPAVRSRLSQVYIPADEASLTEETDTLDNVEDENEESIPNEGHKLDVGQKHTGFQFTFACPHPSPLFPAAPRPNALSTPGRPTIAPNYYHTPHTDPRLRLFQLNYDTFTREHMSAMVDSMQLNTPSGNSDSAFSKQSMTTDPSQALTAPNDGSLSRLRSAKRLKLSPSSDFSNSAIGDGEAVIMRPQKIKDYVGESKSLMEKIKKAQDFSTITTVGTGESALTPAKNAPEPVRNITSDQPSKEETIWTAASSQKAIYSSVARQEGAATLMEQIRQDMRRHKRLLSVDTEISERQSVVVPRIPYELHEDNTKILTDREGQPEEEEEEDTELLLSETKDITRWEHERRMNDGRDLIRSMTNISIDSEGMLDQFPVPPIVYITSESPMVEQSSAAPSTHPSASIRRKEDLTRFVSSSTASGTTVTANSAASFVKHQGPKFMMQITPNDIADLPDRVGKMLFDRTQMKWVKAPDASDVVLGQASTNDSEDPFKDIESLRGDDSRKSLVIDEDAQDEGDLGVMSMELDRSHIDGPSDCEEDAEEAELTSFSCDYAQPASIPSRQLQQDQDSTEPSEQYTVDSDGHLFDGAFQDNADAHKLGPALQDTPPHLLAPPAGTLTTPHAPPQASKSSVHTPIVRSAMKQNTATPISAMKDPNRSKMNTPANQIGHRRSVSFSDGKRDGPILGLGRNVPTPDGTLESAGDLSEVSGPGPSAPPTLSARTKRIADLLEDLGDTSYDDTPSKTSSGRPSTEALQLVGSRKTTRSPIKVGNSRRDVPRRSSSLSAKFSRSSGRSANATFLTECSFGVAHDRLVQVLTDVHPFEPHWEELTAIDLNQKNLDSVARLKEFMPRLDSLFLNKNQLSWLSGVPSTVRTLSVAFNRLTAVTSFSHLLNLENLDISHNAIESLRQLEYLRHLRELRADGNLINGLDGLQKMDGLVKLSLQDNLLENINLTDYRWTRLEMLNLSHNRLVDTVGLSSLPALIALNLDNNHLAKLDPGGTMSRLKILRVSGNRLQQFNAAPFSNLRTLYADNNCLGPILKAHRMTKLDNLSLRNQNGNAGLSLSIRDIRDVKRLYLSGNPLKPGFMSEPCYNLFYLELAACRLTTLPAEFSSVVPNVRVLNLNYNFLEDVRALEGLTRLRKLTIIGSRIKATKQFIRMLKGKFDIEMLDLRMNPCTLGWYLPLLVRDVPGALQPSDKDRGPLQGLPGSAALASSAPSQTSGSIGEKGLASRAAKDAGGASSDDHPPNAASTANHDSSLYALAARQGSTMSTPLSGAASSSARRAHPKAVSRSGPRSGDLTWQDLDAKFRRDLPDEAYVGRLGYRGLVMRACPAIRILDGVQVTEKERDKAERLLKSVLDVDRGPKAGDDAENAKA